MACYRTNFTNGKQTTTVSARRKNLRLLSQALSFLRRQNRSRKKDFSDIALRVATQYIYSLSSVIVRVSVVLERTVGDND